MFHEQHCGGGHPSWTSQLVSTASQPIWVMGRENLRNGASASLATRSIFRPSASRPPRPSAPGPERDILRGRNLRGAQSLQVVGNAGPPRLDAIDDMAPVITVEGYPVDEQRYRSLSPLEIGDASGFYVCKAAAGVKARDVHGWLYRAEDAELIAGGIAQIDRVEALLRFRWPESRQAFLGPAILQTGGLRGFHLVR